MSIKRNTIRAVSALTVGITLLSACKDKDKAYAQNDVLIKNIDKSAKPGDDFFQYANGAWLKNNPIPAAYSSWSIFNLVQEDLRNKMLKINEDAVKAGAPKGSNTQKIGDFYYSGMDTVTIEKLGLSPLKDELAKIDAVKDVNGLVAEFTNLLTIGVKNPIAIYAGQDDRYSEKIIMQLSQSGIGLPNRDYYYKTDEHTTKVRNDYRQKHLPALFKFLGNDDAAAKTAAEKTYALEKFLADSSRTLEDLRDPYHNYNKMGIAGVTKLAPLINWKTTFDNSYYKNVDTVIIGQPEYLRAVNTALNKFSINDWKNYLRKNLLNEFSPYLHKAAADESFRFYGTVISGKTEQLPRWKRILDIEEDVMGEVLGQIFVKEYFPEPTKKRYEDMVEAVRASFKDHIEKLDWMSPETKKRAYEKLAKVYPKVGFPDHWRDYSGLDIDKNKFVQNIINSSRFDRKFNAAKLGKPVDRTEWGMTPQTYNAYYNPSNNEIVLPAAIFMVPGTLDEKIDDAVVYGYGAASTIGHEITHGFDDQGRQYDEKGNLKPWWSAQDSAKFAQRADMLVKQFNGYKVNDLHINGKATLGENIADLGGVVIGLDAFKKTKQYKEGKTINGLTPVQRYFLGYALGWLGHDRKESLANQVLTDVHSPRFMRVNGPFSDVPEFYEAFGVKKGDKMWLDPDKRVKIW
ncbi:M13 family metallopeptidase [Mucilaginibacter phyllosphaerae]|uniref:Endopeptidase n=1 Tax=Mucilaginibacter phyllosphaerae TaxID=1812349 RepID=A0A4Y8A5T8_9SPHI|nr:M13 family metallopeptidase [Mucilaginibacter phyllosphaerae]MBB3971027.1 putative endopeptidase [Mucilaginibacter phyllosphaerae]TEW63770.1 M13 family peptidase [Mucilaginibacter phyllosphaerae]GGH22038.1 peptidase M13 [Mucilaginibacter phyllosphaerae]